jgi:hypothetical protein
MFLALLAFSSALPLGLNTQLVARGASDFKAQHLSDQEQWGMPHAEIIFA